MSPIDTERYLLICFIKLFLAIILLTLITLVNGQCSNISVRKEFRQLSDSERLDFINAVKALNQGTRPNRYDNLSKWHTQARYYAHQNPQFLPWHRAFVREFEKALQSTNPNVVVPYWDWSLDYEDANNSPIFSNSWLGGSGSCVTNGQFANWQVTYVGDGSASPHCLERQINLSKDEVRDPYRLQNIISTRDDYDDFRSAIEVPHDSIHVGVGGDMLDLASPNDPIFYMHHAFVDKLWADWQSRDPSFVYRYSGTNSDGSTASIYDTLTPFNTQVWSTMDTTSDGFCYRYDGAQSMVSASSTRLKSSSKPKLLTKPKPLPESIILKKGGNVTRVREQEAKEAKFVLEFNQNITSNRPINIAAKIRL
ncbi:uncharacterized protein VTP21DRAFT_2565 [Calcarisporiella thermophila]|uniref:uncharacterized protein n=1 Tax=Calcarisporiella thermophila TaxID=911321 RepID=UPI00374275D4